MPDGPPFGRPSELKPLRGAPGAWRSRSSPSAWAPQRPAAWCTGTRPPSPPRPARCSSGSACCNCSAAERTIPTRGSLPLCRSQAPVLPPGDRVDQSYPQPAAGAVGFRVFMMSDEKTSTPSKAQCHTTPTTVPPDRPGPRLVAAVVDRVTFNAHIIETGAQSYRLRMHQQDQRTPQRAG